MESIGEKLTHAREARGLSVDQASRETHIARRFLLALEEERFTDLPGETYLLGFLRTYSDFIGLDGKTMVSLYRNTRLQETEAPIEQLIPPRTSLPLGPLLAGLAAVLVIGASVLLIPRIINRERPVAEEPSGRLLPFAGTVLDERLQTGDRVQVTVGGEPRTIRFAGLENGQILLEFGEARVSLLPEERLDLAELSPELEGLQVSARNPSQVAGGSAVFRFEPVSETLDLAAGTADGGDQPGTDADSEAGSASGEADGTEVGAGRTAGSRPAGLLEPRFRTSVGARQREVLRLPVEAPPGGSSVTLAASGSVLVQLAPDDAGERLETLGSGDSITLTFGNELSVIASNSAALTVQVDGTRVPFGGPGGIDGVRLVRTGDDGATRVSIVPVY